MVSYDPFGFSTCNCGMTACNCTRVAKYKSPTITYIPDPNEARITSAANILRDMPCQCVGVKAAKWRVVTRKCSRCRALDALGKY